MKVVINKCFGGFSVSRAVYEAMGKEWDGYGFPRNEDFGIVSDDYNAYRANQELVGAIEKVGLEAAAGFAAKLRIVEVPDGVVWEIDEYDGMETLRERSRYFG